MKTYSISENSVYQISRDFTVSGKDFKLLMDQERDMLITFPKPAIQELPEYYKSEKYISHTDSKSNLLDKIYQGVKKYMLVKKLKWIEKKVRGKGRILDIGAGTGDFLIQAKKRGWKVNGVEPNERARAQASRKGINLSPDARNYTSEKFDVITMWHVLEHVYDLKAQVIELDHLLKSNGLLVIAVPNYKSYDAQYYKEFWAAYDVPRHLWHFSRASFRHVFTGTGFRQTDTRPLIFDSFYVSLLSEKYKGSRFGLLKSFYVGLKSNIRARNTSEYSSITYFFRKTH